VTTIHVDLRDLTAEPIPLAWMRVAPSERSHVEDGDDYIRTGNFHEVRIIDGEATFDVPATDPGQALIVAEHGFRGARIRHLAIPDLPDVDYGDLLDA
jgi:hypothetical protein